MNIVVNENPRQINNALTLFQLRDALKPNADIIICNGTPISSDHPLQPGDHVTLIQYGEQPDCDELEALLIARHTPEVHAALKKATIGIAGAGGLGSSIAVALTRAGIGKLIIADFDVVEPSNLNRQQYFIDQIGMAKVEALRINLQRINPFTAIMAEKCYLDADNIPGLFADVDVMVEAFDCPETKAMLIQLWLHKFPDTPLVAASGVAGYAASNTICTRQMMNKLYLCGDGVSAVESGISLMAPRVGIAAHHQANTVIRLLLGIDPIEEKQ
ncbi:MAG: sulfur carrier protein ThiS adenylyltransferase ThiF [Thermodesulfobacteriota bacterium]|nr:sulfur carrier protein ThiS adenylyltransferase ThiF [Thermodesulfobacteriota bacterium]